MIELFNKDAEESVLGSILLDGQPALDRARDILSVDDFYTQKSRIIFDCAIDLTDKKIPLDMTTVGEGLGKEFEKVGGYGYLAQLVRNTPSSVNLEHYAKIVRDKSLARQVIQQCDDVKKRLMEEENPTEVSSQLMLSIMKSISSNQKSEIVKIGREVTDVYNNLDNQKSANGITGISTGFPELDRIGGGLQSPSYNILAARPSIGKTTFAMNIAKNVSYDLKIPTLMFSLEMSNQQLARKFLALCSSINSKLFHNVNQISGKQWDDIANGANTANESELYIDDTCNLKASEIWVRSRKFKTLNPKTGLIIIDYLQLMAAEHPKMSPIERVSECSRITRNIARELGIPVITLSQLSRGVEQRENKIPILSDLRESGSIEQDADTVIFLYRPDYYNDDKSAPDPSETAVILAKNRLEGGIGAVKLKYYKAQQKFM